MISFIKYLFKKHVHQFGGKYIYHRMLVRKCHTCNEIDIIRDYELEAINRRWNELIKKHEARTKV